MMEKLYTLKEAKRLLGVTTRTWQRQRDDKTSPRKRSLCTNHGRRITSSNINLYETRNSCVRGESSGGRILLDRDYTWLGGSHHGGYSRGCLLGVKRKPM
ncbi:MAG: hypothetical protein QXN85_02465 [Candidatus Bathyarchaeia archaeon]